MRKHIPAKEEVVCDRCLQDVGPSPKKKGRCEFRLKATGNALDHLGDPAAAINETWDFCDECAESFYKFLKS